MLPVNGSYNIIDTLYIYISIIDTLKCYIYVKMKEMISLRGEISAHKTSLTRTSFYGGCPYQARKVSIHEIVVMGIDL